MAETIKIGGELESTATGNVVAAASAIEDKAKGKKQSQINEETDSALDNRYTKDETYTKTEVNNIASAYTSQKYVTVEATEQTTDVTEVLPDSGQATDTIYRVAKWDGTAYNTGYFAYYTWNGSAYIPMSLNQPGIDTKPIAGSHNFVDSEGVDNAVNTFPKSIQNLMGGLDIVEITRGGKIATSGDNCTITNIESDATRGYALIPCVAGDNFTFVTGTSGSAATYRTYAWLGTPVENVAPILYKIGNNWTPNNVTITAPANTAYLLLNINLAYPYLIYKGDSKDILTLSSNVVAYKSTLSNSSDMNTLETGFYGKTTSNVPQNWPADIDSSGDYTILCLRRSDDCTVQFYFNREVTWLRIKHAGTWYLFNITKNDYVGYNDVQTLTDEQKAIARNNIDAVSPEIYSDLEDITGNSEYHDWLDKKAYVTSGDTIDITSPVSNSSLKCIVVSCSAGDKFTLTGIGALSSNYIPYVFIDSSGNKLEVANKTSFVDDILTAPENTAYLVVNITISHSSYLLKGASVKVLANEAAEVKREVGDVVQKDLKTWEDIQSYTVLGEVGSAISYGSNAAYSHFLLSVVASQQYEINTLAGGSSLVYYVIFTDNNDIVVRNDGDMSGESYSSYDLLTMRVTVPAGATKMYVNSHAYIGNSKNVGNTKAYLLSFDDLQTQINNLNETINNIENDDAVLIPDYYFSSETEGEKDYLTKKLDRISYIQEHIGKNSDGFFFITDYHYHKSANNSPELIKYIRERTGIEKLFFGGDVGRYSTDPYKEAHSAGLYWDILQGCVPEFFGVIGNHEWTHDINRPQDDPIQTGTYSEAGVLNFYNARHKRNADGMEANNGNYWIDNKVNKIRYFFIHVNAGAHPLNYTSATGSNAWFANALTEVPNGYSVVLIVHTAYVNPSIFYYQANGRWVTPPAGTLELSNILDAFNNGGNITVVGNTYDYSNKENVSSIGIFCGHRHQSCLCAKGEQYIQLQESGGVVSVVRDGEGNPVLFTNNSVSIFQGSDDSLADTASSADTPNVQGVPWYWEDFNISIVNKEVVVSGTKIKRVKGTTNEQCFYVVNIDLDARKVYITAIGGDHDWEFDY